MMVFIFGFAQATMDSTDRFGKALWRLRYVQTRIATQGGAKSRSHHLPCFLSPSLYTQAITHTSHALFCVQRVGCAFIIAPTFLHLYGNYELADSICDFTIHGLTR